MLIYVNDTCQVLPSGTLKDNATFSSTGQYVQLTDAVVSQHGELEYSATLSTKLQIDFDFKTGGGTGAYAVYFYYGASATPADEDHGNSGYIFAYDEYSGDNAPFQITYNTSRLANTSGSASFADNQWHHARIIINGSVLTMFLDGVQVLTLSDSARTLGGKLYGFGARTGGINNKHLVRNLLVQSTDLTLDTNSAVHKRYYYKIYDTNLKYVTTWSTDVISDPTFRTVLNGGAGDLTVMLARKYDNFGENVDVALGNRVELWTADNDNLSNNSLASTLWDSAKWDVDVWDNPIRSFVKLYTGVISQ